MIWFRATTWDMKIAPVEIDKETDLRVLVHNGLWVSKSLVYAGAGNGTGATFFRSTADSAKQAMVEHFQECLAKARAKVVDAELALEKAEGLKV